MGLIGKLPSILLPYQQKWHSDRSKVAIWEKSRRIGASWCDAADSVLTASAARGMDVLYIGYNRDMAEEYIRDSAMWARASNTVASEMQEMFWKDGKEEILTYVLRFAAGYKILALSSQPRSLRSRQGKVVIDEAAHHDDLPGLLKSAMALLMWGGKVKILSTHLGVENPFNALIGKVVAGELPYSLHRTTLSDARNQGLYQRICMVSGEERARNDEDAWAKELYEYYGDDAGEELDCIPSSGTGSYLPRALIKKCQRPGIPIICLAKPKEWYLDSGRIAQAGLWIADNLQPVLDNIPFDKRTVLGQDFGRSGDLSVIWVLQDICGGIWETAFILELRRIPFDVQRLILFHIVRELPLFHGGKLDASGNGESLAEEAQQEFGVHRIEAIKITSNWYASEFPQYKAAWEGGLIIAPESENIIADHRRVILTKGRPTIDDKRDKGSDGQYRHGDSAVAGVMAWSATRNEIGPAAGVTMDAGMDDYLPEMMIKRGGFWMFKGD